MKNESHHALLRIRLQEFREDGIPKYLTRLYHSSFYKDMVTTLVGVRKSGKTYTTYQVIDQMLSSGKLKSLDQVCYLHFDDESLMTFGAHHLTQIDEALLQINSDIHSDTILYVFDEIHKISGWEGFVLRLLRKRNSRVLVTGSSSDLEPDRVNRQLRGKSVAEHIYPLSFLELCQWNKAVTDPSKWSPRSKIIVEHLFDQYIRWGSFPGMHETETDRKREALLKTYCSTIVASDFMEKNKNADPALIKHYLFRLLQNNTGSYTHRKMLDALSGIQLKIDKRQLYTLAHLAEENYLFDFVQIYASSQAKINQNPRKVYCADWAMANVVAFPAKLQTNRAIEAIVYWELKRRGYQVRYYRHPNTNHEVDFIAYNIFESPELAIQVTWQMDDKSTITREARSLTNLKAPEFSNTKRIILTMRPVEIPGVTVINLIEWLLSKPQ
jgi:predicted AAA+ superfamily ATPase